MESKQTKKIAVLGLVSVVIIVLIVLLGTGSGAPEQTASVAPNLGASLSSFKVEDLVIGTGREANIGNVVTVHYTGRFTDGRVFDSSLEAGVPFQFPLGSGHVIPCWDQGFQGKKVGAELRLTCPPNLAYGSTGVPGAIPPDATLIFDVAVINIEGGITE